jgi:hypothetical protein
MPTLLSKKQQADVGEGEGREARRMTFAEQAMEGRAEKLSAKPVRIKPTREHHKPDETGAKTSLKHIKSTRSPRNGRRG